MTWISCNDLWDMTVVKSNLDCLFYRTEEGSIISHHETHRALQKILFFNYISTFKNHKNLSGLLNYKEEK